MPTISLRQANPADWPTVEALLKANQVPVNGAREHLSTFVVAESGREVVGCSGAEPRGDVALLRSVAVAQGLHHQGIGREMVSLVLQEARRRNFKAVYLLTTTARDYFRRLGFVLADRTTAPKALQQSAEFQGACPASADFMMLAFEQAKATGLENLPVAVLGAGPVGLAAAASKPLRRPAPTSSTTAMCASSRPGATTSTRRWPSSWNPPAGAPPNQNCSRWRAKWSIGC